MTKHSQFVVFEYQVDLNEDCPAELVELVLTFDNYDNYHIILHLNQNLLNKINLKLICFNYLPP
jgi:hypothetical protein